VHVLLGAALAVGLPPVPGFAFAQSGWPERVEAVRFHSPALGVEKRFLVHLPRNYRASPARRYPVVVLLHGHGGSEADWVEKADAATVADSLATAGGPEFILVMPDGDNGYWTDAAEWAGYAACAAQAGAAEPAGTRCVARARYGTYLAVDLLDYLDRHFRTIPDRRARGVAGLSMGGTGALTTALVFPGRFAAAASLSGVVSPLWVGPGRYLPGSGARDAADFDEFEAAEGAPAPVWRARFGPDTTQWWRQDPARAVRRLRAGGIPIPALSLDVGLADPYLDHNRVLHDRLLALGVAHAYVERPGGHEWAYWRSHLGATLAWLGGRLLPARGGR